MAFKDMYGIRTTFAFMEQIVKNIQAGEKINESSNKRSR